MPNLRIQKNHRSLRWLHEAERKCSYKGRSSPLHAVPGEKAKEMKGIGDISSACEFLEKAGLFVVNRKTAASGMPVFSIDVFIEDPGLAGEVSAYNYPQVVLTSFGSDVLPAGTITLNMLVPEGLSGTQAENVFAKFQRIVLALSIKLQAFPFACITGFKIKQFCDLSEKLIPKHDLDHRGFRFFFSPQPHVLFNRIKEILNLRLYMDFLDMNDPNLDLDAAINKTNRLQELNLVVSEGRAQPASFFEDVRIQDKDTVLIDLRDSFRIDE